MHRNKNREHKKNWGKCRLTEALWGDLYAKSIHND